MTIEAPSRPPPTRRRRELRGALAALMDCTDREVLCESPAGCGKTHGILAKIQWLAWQYPRSRHLICRATRVSCTESILKTWEDQILGPDHPAYSGNASRATRHSYDFPNGSIVVVGGLSEDQRLFSTEWDTVYVAEATEITEENWEHLGRAMRNGKMPYAQRIADCNPVAPTCWLNQRADAIPEHLRNVTTREEYDRLQEFNRQPLQGKMRRLVAKHQDNPAYWDFLKWDWTEQGRAYVLGELKNLSGHRRKRLFEGLWVAGSGSVFMEFDTEIHVVDSFDPPPDWPQCLGYDPGYAHVTAVEWVALAPDNGLFVVNEIHQSGRSVQEHCEEIKRINATHGYNVRRMYADPQAFFNNTAQGSCHRQAINAGLRFHPWPSTVKAGAQGMVEAVRQRLINATKANLPEGTPYLRICRRCKGLIMEMQNWSYRRTATGELPQGDDAYEDRTNDGIDVIKGIVASGFLRNRPEPESEASGGVPQGWTPA